MLNFGQVRGAAGGGAEILWREPNWVPGSFMAPGRRLDLQPNDPHVFTGHRGGTGGYTSEELIHQPGDAVTLIDAEACGIIVTQGGDRFGTHDVLAPSRIRFSGMTLDEFFITAGTSQPVVQIISNSDSDPLVILKHIGPDNPDAESLRKKNSSRENK
jgi:hypothetical protein